MSFSEFKQMEHEWSEVSERANSLYIKNKFQAATKYYLKALLYSELMLQNVADAQKLNIHIASPFFVSCLNLANNYWALENLKKAGDYFFYNVWKLKMLSKEKEISTEMHFEAIKNWEKAVLSLSDFYEKTNQKTPGNFWKEETYQQIQNTKNLLNMKKICLN